MKTLTPMHCLLRRDPGDCILLCHAARSQTLYLRKNEPHPVRPLASRRQLRPRLRVAGSLRQYKSFQIVLVARTAIAFRHPHPPSALAAIPASQRRLTPSDASRARTVCTQHYPCHKPPQLGFPLMTTTMQLLRHGHAFLFPLTLHYHRRASTVPEAAPVFRALSAAHPHPREMRPGCARNPLTQASCAAERLAGFTHGFPPWP
jgi:hypothetical protein